MHALVRPFALILAVLAASAACSTVDDPVATPDATSEAPLPVKATTPEAGPGAVETAEAAAPAEAVEPVVEPADPTPAVDERPFVPAVGARLRYVGHLRNAAGETLFVEVRDQFAAAGEGALDLRRTTRVGADPSDWGEAVSERYRLERDDESIRVGLAPDEFRDVPPPTTILLLPPSAGRTWTLGEDGEIQAKVIDESDPGTLVASIERAVRIELRPDDGSWVEQRWYARGTGLVRVERRDAAGALLLGLVLAGDGDVGRDTILRALPK